MKKTIKIKEHPVELNSSLGWFYCYREQFGHDILPDLMPALESLLTLGVLNSGADPKDVLAALDSDTISEAMINMIGLESVTVLNIIWSLAKNADDDLPDPRTFFDGFDAFPIDTVAPVAFRMIIESSVSSKNAKSLLERLTRARTSLSTRSRSQGSTEG